MIGITIDGICVAKITTKSPKKYVLQIVNPTTNEIHTFSGSDKTLFVSEALKHYPNIRWKD